MTDECDIVLLGAGASRDAGLPLSAGLTDVVIRELEKRGEDETADILRFVKRGLLSPFRA